MNTKYYITQNDISDYLKESYTKHYDRLYYKIYSKTKDEYLTEDICHDTFIIFMEKINDNKIDNIYAWLERTATNLLLNKWRRKENLNEELENDIIQNEKGQDQDLLIELREVIYDCSNYEDETAKEIFINKAIMGMTFTDISKKCGFSRKKVKRIYEFSNKKIMDILVHKGLTNIEEYL